MPPISGIRTAQRDRSQGAVGADMGGSSFTGLGRSCTLGRTMTVAASREGIGDGISSREHVRTMRMQRHLVVAGLACVVCIAIGPTAQSLRELMILTSLIGVVLGLLARAVDARLGYGWGWLYGEPEYSTWLDVFVDSVLRRLTAVLVDHSLAHRSAIEVAGNESKIRMLPPQPDRR